MQTPCRRRCVRVVRPAPARTTASLHRSPGRRGQRPDLYPVGLADLDQLAERIMAFPERYNAIEPFDWAYTRDYFHDVLRRLAEHDDTTAALEAG